MRIALAQINPIIADINGNREKILSCIDKARKNAVDIVVFPEMATIGYPPMDILENKKLIKDNLDSLDIIARHCKGIAAIVGHVDFDWDNPPLLHNAAAFAAEGTVVSRHYKTLLPTYDVFDELRYFSPAKTHNPVIHKGRRIGITICEDIWNDIDCENYMSLDRRRYITDPVSRYASLGIDLLINISASPYTKGKNTTKWEMISGIARKNSLPVIYVNQVGGNDSLIFDGNSFFINKNGDFCACAPGFAEDLLIFDEDDISPLPFPHETIIEDVRKALVLGIRDYTEKCGFSDVVLGLSGGIDSALTASLAVQALGAEHVTGITMPSVYSSQGSVDDSRALAHNLGMTIHTLPIIDLFNLYRDSLGPIFGNLPEGITEENIQARIRGNLLMSMSNKFGSLLLTTGNKSELATGYCTLYGDMSGGLAVISDCPKTLVYELSRHINREREIIPVSTIEKPPSAELRENQKDEDSLPPYEILDGILELYIEAKMSSDEIISQGYDAETVLFVLRLVNRSEYKRIQAATGLKVTSKAFGIGRRIPIANRFSP
jgi:NAD+ synthase (glutamine-hydrolysing)